MKKVYKIVSTNFIRQGGDGYSILTERSKNAYDYGPNLENVLVDYFKKTSPVKTEVEGRIDVRNPEIKVKP